MSLEVDADHARGNFRITARFSASPSALLAHPQELLMDAPLASLDEARRAEMLHYMEHLRDEAGCTQLVSCAPVKARGKRRPSTPGAPGK